MPKPVVFMFSGQGSQYFQMGRALHESHEVFRRWMDRLNELVQRAGGEDVLRVLYGDSGKADAFTDVRYTSPAILMVEFALAQAVMASGLKPDYTLGASLGTYAAAAVSGVAPIEGVVSALLAQGRALNRTCEPGGMIAVMASTEVANREPFRSKATIASFNFASHFVLSAHARDLPEIRQALRRQDVPFQDLPVAHAYHSAWVDPMKGFLVDTGASLDLGEAHVPLACCATAQVLHALPEDHFWKVARQPILFQQTVAALERNGPFHYVDLGPSGTLATFLKYLLPATSASTYSSVMSPYGNDAEKLKKLIALAAT